MRITDNVAMPSGVLRVEVFRAGRSIERWQDENLIVDGARDVLAQLIGGAAAGKPVERVGFGVDGNGPSPDDAALTNAYVKDIGSVSYPAAGKVQFNWTLATSEANGMSICEFGLICGDGSLFSRKVRGAIAKESDISLTGAWTITF